VPDSILHAIKMGQWDYEPKEVDARDYCPTRAMPGTENKLEVLAERVANGLPLWHPGDCMDYDEQKERDGA